MNIGWYIALSAVIFSIGAAGLVSRRNPLVMLLCLELMLNAANLALIAFARMVGNGEGQIFALIVVAIAACEVVVGLGLIVAIYRNQLPVDADALSSLRDASEQREPSDAPPAERPVTAPAASTGPPRGAFGVLGD